MEGYLLLSLMAIVCGVFLWRPLLSNGKPTASRGEHEIEFYKDQLSEIERDLNRGIIRAEEAEASRIEISRKIINCEHEPSSQHQWSQKNQQLFALAAAFFVPVAGLLIYFSQGSPALQSGAAKTVDRGQSISGKIPTNLQTKITALRASLDDNPNDVKAWLSLGRTYFQVGRYQRAAEIFMEATTVFPENADFFARAGEALVLGSNGAVVPAAELAFKRALKFLPKDARSQYYLALGDQQNGRLEEALKKWLQLEADSPPNAPWKDTLRIRITSLSKKLGKSSDSLTQDAGSASSQVSPEKIIPGPNREDVIAAQQLSPEDRREMINSMVEGLAAKLESSPDDLNGWKRLARARKVLGQKSLEKIALKRVAELQPRNVEAQLEYLSAVVELASPDNPNASELKPVLARILERDDRNPRALWYSGVLAKAEGRKAAAVEYWSNLLSITDPNSPQYVELRNEIMALEK